MQPPPHPLPRNQSPRALESSVLLLPGHPLACTPGKAACSVVHGTKLQETSKLAEPPEPHCWVWSCRCAVVPALGACGPCSSTLPVRPRRHACLVWLRARPVARHLMRLPVRGALSRPAAVPGEQGGPPHTRGPCPHSGPPRSCPALPREACEAAQHRVSTSVPAPRCVPVGTSFLECAAKIIIMFCFIKPGLCCWGNSSGRRRSTRRRLLRFRPGTERRGGAPASAPGP